MALKHYVSKAGTLRPFLAPSLHMYQWNFEGSLSWLCFLMHKFFEKRKTSLRSPGLDSQVTASSPVDLTAKSAATAILKFSYFQVVPVGFSGLLVSKWTRELAVTRDARLGDRKLVFRFLKIYAIKTHPTKWTFKFSPVHV